MGIWARVCWSAVVMTFILSGLARAEDETADKPTNPRAVFRMLGVGDKYFDRFVDGEPIAGEGTESLLRILYRLRTFPPIDIDRWAKDVETLGKAVEHPNEFRGSIYLLRGQVTEVQRVHAPTDAAQRYELFTYYLCLLRLDATGQTVVIYTEHVPQAWMQGAKPNARGGAQGVFLKLGEPDAGRPTPVFAARRLAWYPDTPLGNLGMDVGLLDDMKDRTPLSLEETSAFYQMLAAVGRATPGELILEAEAALPEVRRPWRRVNSNGDMCYRVVPLFNNPKASRGMLVDLYGTARRIEEIYVNDPELVARYGIDHYYQISIFTEDSYNLDPEQILQDSEKQLPAGTPCPLTFCVRELPEGMPYGNIPDYNETIRIAGFFLKDWSYEVPKVYDSALPEDEQLSQIQFSPLLIGRDLIWYPMPKSTESTWVTLVISVLFVGFVVIVWGAAWINRRQSKQWEQQAVGEVTSLDTNLELGDLGDDSPDFSHLAEMDNGPTED